MQKYFLWVILQLEVVVILQQAFDMCEHQLADVEVRAVGRLKDEQYSSMVEKVKDILRPVNRSIVHRND